MPFQRLRTFKMYALEARFCSSAMVLLSHRPSNKHVALIASGIVLGFLGYHGHFCSSTTHPHSSIHKSERPSRTSEKGIQKSIPIPPEYGIPFGSADETGRPGACSDAASAVYPHDFRAHTVEHCSSRSPDSISCFHGRINLDRGLFCITRSVVLDDEDKRFSSGCDTSLPSK